MRYASGAFFVQVAQRTPRFFNHAFYLFPAPRGVDSFLMNKKNSQKPFQIRRACRPILQLIFSAPLFRHQHMAVRPDGVHRHPLGGL